MIDIVKFVLCLFIVIVIVWFVGILGVVYVYVWIGCIVEEFMVQVMIVQGLLCIVVIEMFGCSVVLLLGMILGWLVVFIVMWCGYFVFVIGKVCVILLLMLLWSVIVVVVVCLFVWFG